MSFAQSLLFSAALAVGLTPELLPMITTVTLTRGAIRMAKRQVIVKRLASIHDAELRGPRIWCAMRCQALSECHLGRRQCAGLVGAKDRQGAKVAINRRP